MYLPLPRFERVFTFILFLPIVISASTRGSSNAQIRERREVHRMKDAEILSKTVYDRYGNTLPPLNTTYYFDQLIDHQNPELGTFKMQYFHSWQFYEPGMLSFILFT